MRTDAMKPIFGIAVIRLAAVHDPMKERAITALDGLRNHMGTVEMIVPEQHQPSDQGLSGTGDFAAIEEIVELLVYGRLGEDARAGTRAKFWGLGCGERVLSPLKVNSAMALKISLCANKPSSFEGLDAGNFDRTKKRGICPLCRPAERSVPESTETCAMCVCWATIS